MQGLRSRPDFLLMTSLLCWLELALHGQGLTAMSLCSTRLPSIAALGWSWQIFWIANPPLPWIGNWLVMLGAMMLPLLRKSMAAMIGDLSPHHPLMAQAAFIGAYVTIWSAAALPLVFMSFVLQSLASPSLSAPTLAASLTLLWQFSSMRKACLDRCRRPAIATPNHGSATREAALYGIRYGLWCLGACWAMMLLALSIHGLHFLSMAAIACLIWAERMMHQHSGDQRPGRAGAMSRAMVGRPVLP